MTNFCGQCGKRVEKHIKFCPFCGVYLEKTEENISTKEVIYGSQAALNMPGYGMQKDVITTEVYEFIERSVFLNPFSKSTVKVSFKDNQLSVRRIKQVLGISRKEIIFNKDIEQIQSVYLEKKLNKYILFLMVLILVLNFVKGEITWKASWIGAIFILGIYQRSIHIEMRDGSNIKIKNITSVLRAEALFNKIRAINPNIICPL